MNIDQTKMEPITKRSFANTVKSVVLSAFEIFSSDASPDRAEERRLSELSSRIDSSVGVVVGEAGLKVKYPKEPQADPMNKWFTGAYVLGLTIGALAIMREFVTPQYYFVMDVLLGLVVPFAFMGGLFAAGFTLGEALWLYAEVVVRFWLQFFYSAYEAFYNFWWPGEQEREALRRAAVLRGQRREFWASRGIELYVRGEDVLDPRAEEFAYRSARAVSKRVANLALRTARRWGGTQLNAENVRQLLELGVPPVCFDMGRYAQALGYIFEVDLNGIDRIIIPLEPQTERGYEWPDLAMTKWEADFSKLMGLPIIPEGAPLAPGVHAVKEHTYRYARRMLKGKQWISLDDELALARYKVPMEALREVRRQRWARMQRYGKVKVPLAPQALQGSEVVSDVLEAIEQFSATLKEECSPAFLKYREPFIAYSLALASLVRDPSVTTLAIEIGKIVNHDAVFQGSNFHELIRAVRKIIVPQSDSLFVTASIETNPLAKAAYEIFSSLSLAGILKQLGIFSPVTMWYAQQWLSSLMPKDTLDSFVYKVIAFLRILIERVVACVKAGSFAPLFCTRMKFDEWVDAANTAMFNHAIKITTNLQVFQEERAKGAISPIFTRRVTERERADMMLRLYEEGEVFQIAGGGGVQPTTLLGAPQTARELRGKLYHHYQQINARLHSAEFRPVPLGLRIYGPSNVGKSHLLDSLSSIVAADLGVPDRKHVRYDMTEAKFFDGVDVSKVFFVLDDLDQKGGDPGYADTTWCQLIIKAINNAPFLANMAAVEDKGTMWLEPKMVAFVSNKHPTKSEIRKLGANIAATLRRFKYYIHLMVRDPNARNAAGGLKDDVTLRDNTWRHVVYKLNPNNNLNNLNDKTNLLMEVATFDSRMEFLEWVNVTYKAFTKGALEVANRANAIPSTATCVRCGRIRLWHVGECTFAPLPGFVPNQEAIAAQAASTASVEHVDPAPEGMVVEEEKEEEPPVGFTGPVRRDRRRRLRDLRTTRSQPAEVVAQADDGADDVPDLVSVESVRSSSPVPPGEPDEDDRVEVVPDALPKAQMPEPSRVWGGVMVMTLALWFFQVLCLMWAGEFGWAMLWFVPFGTLVGLVCDPDAQKYLLVFSVFGKRFVGIMWLVRVFSRRLPRREAWSEVKAPFVLGELGKGVSWLTLIKVGLGVLAGALLMYLRRAKRVLAAEMQLIPTDSEEKVKIVKQMPSTGFTKVPQLVSAFPSRGVEGMTSSQFLKHLSNSYARVQTRAADGQVSRSWAVYLGNFKWLVNKHAVTRIPKVAVESRSKETVELVDMVTFDYHGVIYEVPTSWRNVSCSKDRDEAVIAAPKVVPRGDGILKFVPAATMASFYRLKEGWLFDPEDPEKPNAVPTGELSYTALAYSRLLAAPSGPRAITYDLPSKAGWCGRVGFVKMNNSFLVVLMHAYSATDLSAIGEELLRGELEALMATLDIVGVEPQVELMPAAYALGNPREVGVGSDAALKPMPQFNSAMAQAWKVTKNFLPLGTMPKYHASKMSSKFVETPVAKEVREMALREGLRLDPAIPSFGGEMGTITRDGEEYFMWKSAFTQSLMDTRNVDGPEDALDWAVNDYLDIPGLREVMKGVQPLTWHEVYRGDKDESGSAVQGIPLFNPKDLNTSTGAPFNTQKRQHMKFEEDGSVHVRDIYHLEAIRLLGMLVEDPNLVILPLVQGSEKDQPIDREKVNSYKGRVFYCSQDAYNSLVKMFLGPVFTRLARLPGSEMALGMNIAGPELDMDFAERQRLDPERKRETAADYAKYDKRESNQVLRYASDVAGKLVEMTDYSEMQKSVARRLLIGAIYCMVLLKGDIGIFGFMLVSGIWHTAHLNSIVNSLLHRAAYYLECKERGVVPRPFREECFLKTLGDDAHGSCREGSVFNQLVLAKHAAKYGMEVTSCVKGAELTEYSGPEVATFLKRHFYKDESCGRWKSPLVMESVLGMLIYVKRPTVGTIEDQLCINYASAKAELYLHGEEKYQEWVSKLDVVMSDYVKSHPLVRRRTYDYLDWKFQVGENIWMVEPELPVLYVAGAVPQMDIVQTPVERDPNTVAVTDAEASMPVASAAATRESPAVAIEDILNRAVRVYEVTVANTDVVEAQIAAFRPYTLYFAAPTVAAKLKNVLGWRGRLKVVIEVASAGTMMGSYIAAVEMGPCGEGEFYDPVEMTFPQAFQAKHNVVVNCSASGSYELEVPWAHYHDYAPTDVNAYNFPTHQIKIYCVTPLRSTLSAGAAVSAYFTIYTAFMPDLKLYSIFPQMQSDRPISSALSGGAAIAGALSSVPAIAPYSMPVSVGLAAASAVASALGYTRKQAQRAVMMAREVRHQFIGPADGEDSSVPSALTSQALVSIDPTIGNSSDGTDETSFAYIFSRPGYVGRATWTTSTANRVILARIPVTPGLVYEANEWYPTPTAYAGALCQFWTGSMIIDVMTVHPPMAGGSYIVFWSPFLYNLGSTMTLDPTAGGQACVVNLGPDNRRSFVVGWSSLHNVARMRLGTTAATFQEREINGYFYVMSGTRLVTPVLAASTAPDVTFHFMTRGGKDLTLGGARMLDADSSVAQYTETLLLNADTTVEPTAQGEEFCILTASKENATRVVETQFGEPILGVRSLAQKFGQVCTAYMTSTGLGGNQSRTLTFSHPAYAAPRAVAGSPAWNSCKYTISTVSDTGVITPISGQPFFHWMGWVRAMFLGIRGGSLVKFVNASGTYIMARCAGYDGPYRAAVATQTPGAYTAGAQTWGATAFASSSDRSPAEFYIPYVSDRLYWPACARPSEENEPEKSIEWAIRTSNNGVGFEVWLAGAADINFLHFRFAPSIEKPSGGGVLMMAVSGDDMAVYMQQEEEEEPPMPSLEGEDENADTFEYGGAGVGGTI